MFSRGSLRSPLAELGRRFATARYNLIFLVRDKLQQRPVWISKVDRNSVSSGAVSFCWSKFDPNAVFFQVFDGLSDWSSPFNAQITSARWHRDMCQRNRYDTRSMEI